MAVTEGVDAPESIIVATWTVAEDGAWSRTLSTSRPLEPQQTDLLVLEVDLVDSTPDGLARAAEQALLYRVFASLEAMLVEQWDARWVCTVESQERFAVSLALPKGAAWRRWVDEAFRAAPGHACVTRMDRDGAAAAWAAVTPTPEVLAAVLETRRLDDIVSEGLEGGDRIDRPRPIELSLGFADSDGRTACVERLPDWGLTVVDLGAGTATHPLGLRVTRTASPLDQLRDHTSFVAWLSQHGGVWLDAIYEPVYDPVPRAEAQEDDDPFVPDLRLLKGDPSQVEWTHALHLPSEAARATCAELLERLGFEVTLGPPPPSDLPTVGPVWCLSARREDVGLLLPAVVWDLHDLARTHGGRWFQEDRLEPVVALRPVEHTPHDGQPMEQHLASVDQVLAKARGEARPPPNAPSSSSALWVFLVSVPLPGAGFLLRGDLRGAGVSVLGLGGAVVVAHVGLLLEPVPWWFFLPLVVGAVTGGLAVRSPQRIAIGCGPRLAHIVAVALVAYVTGKTSRVLAVEPVRLSTSDMAPAFPAGALVAVPRGLLGQAPEWGDIVVVRDPNGLRVGRVLGLPGDDVGVLPQGNVLRNGQPITVAGPALPEGHWWEGDGTLTWAVTPAPMVRVGPFEVGRATALHVGPGELLLAPDVRGAAEPYIVGTHSLLGVVRR